MSEKMLVLQDFRGPFSELLPEYIGYKQAQGIKMLNPAIYKLREMDLFFLDMGIDDTKITREMYEQWTRPKPPEKETSTQKRQSAIRGFANYLVSLGYKDIYTGHDDTRIFKRDFIPYVFSGDEISRMFSVVLESCRDNPSHENDTFHIVMLLYYCCGFRKSEVQNLLMRDIDFKTGKITVHSGKNDVSRIVIASATLLGQMQAYHEKHLGSAMPDDYFICAIKGGRYNDALLYRKYHQLLIEAGIPPRADGGRQRLHDIRHTFCVRALEQMQVKGFDLYTSLPLLSTYLGHKHITETEYYLRMLDDHFDGILQKSASYIPNLYIGHGKDGGKADG